MHNPYWRWAVALVSLYLFLRFFMLPLLPFLIALTVAVLLEPLVLWCNRRLSFQRGFAAAALVTLGLLGAAVGLGVLSWQLFGQAVDFLRQVPTLLEELPTLTGRLAQRYRGIYDLFPEESHALLEKGLQFLAEQGTLLAGEVSAKAIGWGAELVAKLPELTLFLITTVLAVYCTTMSYPRILTAIRTAIPPRWRHTTKGVAACLRSTFWQWMRAEAILSLVTFLLSLLGFWYLGMDYALLAAAAVGLADALPVLGAGAVLIPWGGYHLLLGSFSQGLALLTLYGVVLVVRGLLEPKILSQQAGLPPLAGLAAVYLGYSFFGVPGMLLFPVGMMLFMELRRGGFLTV